MQIKPPANLDKIFGHFEAKAVNRAVKDSITAAHTQFILEVAEGFDQQKTPGGDAWQKLSPAYAKYKQKVAGGKGILQFEGNLKRASLGSELDWSGASSGDSVHLTVDTAVNDPKAKTHEFGRGPIPARPFFRVLGNARENVLKKAYAAFNKEVNKG